MEMTYIQYLLTHIHKHTNTQTFFIFNPIPPPPAHFFGGHRFNPSYLQNNNTTVLIKVITVSDNLGLRKKKGKKRN